MKLLLIFAIFLSLITLNLGRYYPRYQTTNQTSLESDLSLGDLIKTLFDLEYIKTKFENGLNDSKLINAAERVKKLENVKLSGKLVEEIHELTKLLARIEPKNHKSSNVSTEEHPQELSEKSGKGRLKNFETLSTSSTVKPFLSTKTSQQIPDIRHNGLTALARNKTRKTEISKEERRYLISKRYYETLFQVIYKHLQKSGFFD